MIGMAISPYLVINIFVFFMDKVNFERNDAKNIENQKKHGLFFDEAQHTFFNQRRVIAEDSESSQFEKRFHCFGLDAKGHGIITVRFTYHANRIRIFGAGYWRKGKQIYERANPAH